MATAIGIDLGTTNSVIAYWKKDRPEVIENSEGNRITLSYVHYTDDGIIVGNLAKSHKHPERGISNVKRIMGRKYNEFSTLFTTNTIISDDNGNAAISIPTTPNPTIITPPEVSTHILQKLIQQAKERLEEKFSKQAVITVPAYFNNKQREATIEAAQNAGIEVLRLLNEPTAAALAYLHDTQPDNKKTVLIYDFGGGTFDVSIIELHGKRLNVKTIDGDVNLGGKDIDDRLIKYIKNKIQNELSKISEKKQYRVLHRIETIAKDFKHALSTSEEAEDIIEGLTDDGYSILITRDEFNKLNDDIFQKTIDILKNCLIKNNLEPLQIDEILLVGGSSRIPRIVECLTDIFGVEKIRKSVNLDEAVALGAAVYANMLLNHNSQYELSEVLSFSLGTDVKGNRMNTILKKNSVLPTSNTKYYTNSSDNQTVILVKIFEGEDENVLNNTYLGVVKVMGFPPAPKQHVKIAVTFEVDLNGILQVTAKDENGGSNSTLQIALNRH